MIKNILTQLGIVSNDFDDIPDVDIKSALLLLCIHKGYNSDVWSSKALRYWPAFEEKMLLSLGCSDLASFLTMFASEMSANIGNNTTQRKIAMQIILSDSEDKILNRIRQAYKIIILYTRLLQEELKNL